MYNTDQERAQLAASLWKFKTELLAAGFTESEAREIIVTFVRGISTKSGY